ncbi:MAG: glycosyltransferase [Acetatifactor sp.]|nr:glycosyltransferase [Acetatifactor sp.]
MMKLVFVVPLLAPYDILRFESMAKIEDLELHIVVERDTDKEREGWRFQQIQGCQVYLLNSKRFKSYQVKHKNDGYSIEQSRFYPFGLKRLLKKINPDIVLICNAMQAMFASGKREYQLGIIVEDTLRAAEGRTPINKWLKRLAYNKVDFCVPFTQSAIQFLQVNRIEKPIIRSSWSINLELFQDLQNDEEREQMCYKLELPQNKKKYIIISSLIARKGVLQFLGAWNNMPANFTLQSELYICGDGPLRTDILNYLTEHNIINVHLLGTRTYDDVAHYLQCCDVFVLPTLEDLCSLAVFEAMAAGKPILTTIYNGAKEMIVENENGYVFDVMQESSTRKALENIWNSDLQAFGNKSLEIINNYANDIVMERLYLDLIRKKPGSI